LDKQIDGFTAANPNANMKTKVAFVRDTVMQNTLVRQLGSEHFRNLQKQRDTMGVTAQQYTEFEEWLWYHYLYEKHKTKTRTIARRAKRQGTQPSASLSESEDSPQSSDDESSDDESSDDDEESRLEEGIFHPMQ
jgi:hypothetical protein